MHAPGRRRDRWRDAHNVLGSSGTGCDRAGVGTLFGIAKTESSACRLSLREHGCSPIRSGDPLGADDIPFGSWTNEVERIAGDQGKALRAVGGQYRAIGWTHDRYGGDLITELGRPADRQQLAGSGGD